MGEGAHSCQSIRSDIKRRVEAGLRESIGTQLGYCAFPCEIVDFVEVESRCFFCVQNGCKKLKRNKMKQYLSRAGVIKLHVSAGNSRPHRDP